MTERTETHGSPAPGYAARHTLPLSVEIVRQFRRRRTLVMFGLLLALPWVLVIAFKVGTGTTGQNTLRLSDLATESALNFAAFALSVSVGFLLVVAVGLFCGDTVASEASWSSLRYLLAAPVPRSRLLRQKLIVALGYSAAAVISLPLMALLAGTVAFGWDDIQVPITGEIIPAAAALPRFGIVIGYALVSQLVVASVAFLLSTTTDSPLGAVGGAVGLVIVSNILQAVEALGVLREFLPTFWNSAWLDALAPELEWGGMLKGASVSVTYSVILLALAFRRFRRKDIVS
ncbi:ABC transporter permease subunit [Streptosporangium soli]|nr:ABC transporter permease [Streptosporangium sp. KLBMP 9127]